MAKSKKLTAKRRLAALACLAGGVLVRGAAGAWYAPPVNPWAKGPVAFWAGTTPTIIWLLENDVAESVPIEGVPVPAIARYAVNAPSHMVRLSKKGLEIVAGYLQNCPECGGKELSLCHNEEGALVGVGCTQCEAMFDAQVAAAQSIGMVQAS
jgi:hypothetical protein